MFPETCSRLGFCPWRLINGPVMQREELGPLTVQIWTMENYELSFYGCRIEKSVVKFSRNRFPLSYRFLGYSVNWLWRDLRRPRYGDVKGFKIKLLTENVPFFYYQDHKSECL